MAVLTTLVSLDPDGSQALRRATIGDHPQQSVTQGDIGQDVDEDGASASSPVPDKTSAKELDDSVRINTKPEI